MYTFPEPAPACSGEKTSNRLNTNRLMATPRFIRERYPFACNAASHGTEKTEETSSKLKVANFLKRPLTLGGGLAATHSPSARGRKGAERNSNRKYKI